jgi:adenylate kinase family enzyme
MYLGKRIIIVGNSGSGKSTISRQLGELLKLPVVHLDKEYWQKGWVRPPQEEWNEKIKTLVSAPEWIMDGIFSDSLEIRLIRADTVIFLDYNRFVCLYGALKRWRTYLGKSRPDAAEGCVEKIDFVLLKWVLWTFPNKSRKKIINHLSKHDSKNIIVIKNRKALNQFLRTIVV